MNCVCKKNVNLRAGDRLRVGWEGCRESRRCSRDTYPETYITKYTSMRRKEPGLAKLVRPNRLRLSNVKRFRGGLVFKAHRLLYHSTLGLRVINKKRKKKELVVPVQPCVGAGSG